MKIGVNGRLLLAHRMEGVARYIYETTKRMVLSHPEHTFHLFLDRAYKGHLFEGANLHVHVLKPPARHPILWKIWFEWSLRSAMAKYKIDVLYSGESYLSLRSKVPTVMVSHDINYYHYPDHIRKSHLKYFRKYFPQFHHKASRIIAVSNFTKRDIKKAYGIDDRKIKVAHNACPDGFNVFTEDHKQLLRDKHSDGKEYFVYVGSLHPRKNVDVLIKAFSHFKSQYPNDHKLIIFGRVAFKTDAIKAAYEQSEHKEDIVFLGNEDADVKNILAAAKALCYISIFEGFGIPILEAFSCGVPVITSDVSSMPEVAGDAALLVNPQDINEISSAMHKITADKDLVESLIKKGLKRKDVFSWESSAQTIMDNILSLSGTNN